MGDKSSSHSYAMDARDEMAVDGQQQRKRGRPRLIDKRKDKLLQSVMQQRGTTNARMIQDELARAHSVKLTYEVIRRRVKELSLRTGNGGATAAASADEQADSDSEDEAKGTEPQTAASETASGPDEAPASSSEHQRLARDLDLLAETVRTIARSAHDDHQGALSEPSDLSHIDDDIVMATGSNNVLSSAVLVADEETKSAELEPQPTSFLVPSARGENGEYPLEVCQLVVAKFANGETHKQIALELRMPTTSVQTIIKKAKRKGAVLPVQRAGRPRATSETLEHTILELVRSEPTMSARAVQTHLAANSQLDVSFETIRRRVRDCKSKLRSEAGTGEAPGLGGEQVLSSDSDEDKEAATVATSSIGFGPALGPSNGSFSLGLGAQLTPPAKRRKYGEYSNELREACVQKHEGEGLTYAAISSQLNIPHDTVRAIVRKAKKTGTVCTAPRSGRPRKTSDIVDKVILQAVKANQRCTAKMIQEDLWTVFNVKVSCETVRRRVKANTKQRLVSSPPSSPTAEPASGFLQPALLLAQVPVALGFPSEAPLIPIPLTPAHLVGVNTGMLAPLPIPNYQSQVVGSQSVMQSILNFQAHQEPTSLIVGDKSTTLEINQPVSASPSSLADATVDATRKKRNDYSVEVRERCVSLHAQGHGYRRIGQELKMPHTTVRAIVEKAQRTGTVLPAARSGRPRKTDEIVDRVILQAVKSNEKCSARAIQEELENAYGVKVSCETVRRRVKDHSRQRHASSSALLLMESLESSQESQGFAFGVLPQVRMDGLQPAVLHARPSFQAQLQEVRVRHPDWITSLFEIYIYTTDKARSALDGGISHGLRGCCEGKTMEGAGTEASEAKGGVDASHQHQHEKSYEVPGSSPLASSETQMVDDVLELAVQDVGALIPAERSVLFVYDKSTNQLKPQFVCSHFKPNLTESGHGEESNDNTAGHAGFPPIMGMISACFLHKRCLRMQEPHPHRAFHRDYDAPKDMSIDSILCAPIILHHRVIGVIQLINRIDLDAAVFHDDHTTPSAPASHTGQNHLQHNEDEREIKLRRLNTVKAHARIGFSPKDEQKLIQFASHVAQVVESKLKLAAGDSETQAALRDEHARSALELLSMLNEKLDYQGSGSGTIVPRPGPMSIRKKAAVLELEVAFEIPEQAPTPPPRSPKSALVPEIDSLLVVMAIVRVQARFRSRCVRRAKNFSDALEKFRLQKQRLRSAILIQRLARGSIVRRAVRSQKQAVRLLARAYNKFKFRAKIEDHIERRRSEKPLDVRAAGLSKASKPQFPKRLGVVSQDIDKFRGGIKSLAALQKRFRGRQASKIALAEQAAAMRKLIKLQSFLRGSLVRHHVKELLMRVPQSPTIVCLRIASGPGISPNQLGHSECRWGDQERPQDHRDASNCCVYAMPERVAQATYVIHKRSRATRHRIEGLYDQIRNPEAAATRRAWVSESQTHQPALDSVDYAFGVELRRLTPSSHVSNSLPRSSPRATTDTLTSTKIPLHRLSQAFPGFAFDPMRRKGKQSPPGVEYSSEVVVSQRGLDPGPGSPTQRPRSQHRVLESQESNAFRRQAFCAAVGISRTDARSPGSGLPELGLRGLSRQQTQRDQTLLCRLLPTATINKFKHRLQRDSRLSVSLGLSQQSPPPSKRPSTTTTPGSFSDELSPRAFGSHRKLTVPRAAVIP